MTPGQRKTAFGCSLILVALLAVGVGALYVELTAAGRDDGSTISELFWIVWARQPWVVFIVSHLVAAPVWYVLGHLTAQRARVYDEIGSAAPLLLAALALVSLQACSTLCRVVVKDWASCGRPEDIDRDDQCGFERMACEPGMTCQKRTEYGGGVFPLPWMKREGYMCLPAPNREGR